MLLLGLDIGSSSIKAKVIDSQTGSVIGSAVSPETEMEISSPFKNWAEQHPDLWWENVLNSLQILQNNFSIKLNQIGAIGISYQMHGLVLVDKNLEALRPAIIWCDSRTAETEKSILAKIPADQFLRDHLNLPGNFTISKLVWVKENEPQIFEKVYKFCLPGDYIAMKLSGEMVTTNSGLSEGIFWNFQMQSIDFNIIEKLELDRNLIPAIKPTFGEQCGVSSKIAEITNLKEGTPITYRAGDQPNNALSLNVLNPGEVAATAGTSGVVYGVSDKSECDHKSRVNTFIHVNNELGKTRNGILMCLNGTGIQYSWLKNKIIKIDSYGKMNKLAETTSIGSEGVRVYPFGNGAERILENRNPGGRIEGLNFNRHSSAHLIRAAQEGIVFALKYGLDIMAELGVETKIIRAGNSNMFQSKIFCETFAGVTGASIELYNTDGAQGAAIGAGIGIGIYSDIAEAFSSLKILETITPEKSTEQIYTDLYRSWLAGI
ncbi:MAG: carbohydrate kinase [Melioribacteraceae bacterium]|nr:carbohydrate kinase [Melioribacteraceae bacterium]MCF8264980.1 carbohydrate kinase [Melioribacteraceae bacterium]MCF8413080.1 carbohydrate kinase [Melioribacteraceae bacterium]MCF8431633.1 carbohydrate kinase [Melioribacteraceae bacterium]